ncbi:HAD-IA family hydrolase [Paracoccus sp. M683]|uniref:HAD-IA family hydrolase n=1 Tax=Paracoccus sp. M683 TaxID=2594268 RepID=UPI00117CB243|nr:HAD-IA family hydrolase [Paracoccus sp. M683]TRW98180.1 HAD-IA family hydrolase [Paracoccus sp. M683]
MMLTADALAFDMDGTLVDSHPVIIASWTEWAERRGLNPQDVIDFCPGRPLHRIIGHFAPDADLMAEARWVLDRLPRLEHLLRPVPGASDLLASLAPGEWALVTSAPSDLARRWMGICNLPLPPLVITADDVAHPKPDPQPFALAAMQLGHDPARMLAFEDSHAGLASARAAGMPTIGLGGAEGSAASIRDYMIVTRQPGPAIQLKIAG